MNEKTKGKFRFHKERRREHTKHLGERKVNASMIMLNPVSELKQTGMWEDYEKEANPDFTFDYMLEYYKDGGLYGWVAYDKDRKQYAGFVLGIYTDYNLEPALLGSNVYIKPEYRSANIDAMMYEAIWLFAKIIGVKHILVMADDMRVARWILRRYAPNNVVILMERKV
jgi:GNAT superfamily N-acetyltransferase